MLFLKQFLPLSLPRLTWVRQIPCAYSLDTGYPITSKRPVPHSNSVKGLFLLCFIHSAKPGRGGCTCQHLGLSSTLSIYEAEAGQLWIVFVLVGNSDRKNRSWGVVPHTGSAAVSFRLQLYTMNIMSTYYNINMLSMLVPYLV